MSRLTSDDQEHLLRLVSQVGAYGRSEGESSETFRQTYLPIPEHVRAFDPDVVLIVGERGAGKSELFRAVLQEKLLPAIRRYTPLIRSPGNPTFAPGYPLSSEFPAAGSLLRFARERRGDAEAMPDLWLAYLLRALREHLDHPAQQALRPLLSLQGGATADNFTAFRAAGDEPVLALDRLDRQLLHEDRWLFVGYDELDTLGRSDWQAMGLAIQGLISLWATYSRRWRRLRAKIFLRTDLFHRHGALAGAELAKLAANRVELSWSDRNLYAMLVKRIANFNPELREYCEKARLRFEALDPELGLIPKMHKADEAKPLVDRLIGEFMGANASKGKTFYWLLDHVRDGHDKAFPRPLLRLIERGAQIELDRRQAKIPTLIHHTSLRRALDDVSSEHVKQMIASECPWLHGVKQRVTGLEVPCPRIELERRLAKSWETSWSEAEGTLPPTANAAELVDTMIELGIVRNRAKGQLDTPDLFRAGLGLTRRGGVARGMG